jgi:hypothetical protein
MDAKIRCSPRWIPIETNTLLCRVLHCHMFIFQRRLPVLCELYIIYTHTSRHFTKKQHKRYTYALRNQSLCGLDTRNVVHLYYWKLRINNPVLSVLTSSSPPFSFVFAREVVGLCSSVPVQAQSFRQGGALEGWAPWDSDPHSDPVWRIVHSSLIRISLSFLLVGQRLVANMTPTTCVAVSTHVKALLTRLAYFGEWWRCCNLQTWRLTRASDLRWMQINSPYIV